MHITVPYEKQICNDHYHSYCILNSAAEFKT